MENLNNKNCEVLPVLTFNKTDNRNQKDEAKEIICLKCERMYEFPTNKDEYLAHLFLEHRLIISDVEDIPFLEEYLQYWHREFHGVGLEEYCTTMLLDQLPNGEKAKNERYFLLSDILPKDYELRRQLREKNLERALAQHQFERTDRSFKKECLYCRDVITGLRADYLAHLFTKHFLLLGKSENLVFIDELLAKVQSNLEQLICLYCEKVFKDRITLKEHMRKKGHKRINENNREYDKYFLVNYRIDNRPKTQKKLHSTTKKSQPSTAATTSFEMKITETERDRLSDIASSSVDFENRLRRSDDSDSDWSDWNDGDTILLRCLFCNQNHNNFNDIKQHMLETHQLDFDASVKELSIYQRIKIVNFVRRQMCLLRCVKCDERKENIIELLKHMELEKHFTLGTSKQWDKPEYFFPTYEDDGLLWVLDDSAADDNDIQVRVISEDTTAQINKDAERLSLEDFNF